MVRSDQRGFTLVELLVVMAIFVLISAIVLADNNRFGGQVLVENLAYDVALSVREAQVYGISTRGINGNFTSGYGVHFDSSSPSSYVLFADLDGTGVYNAAISGETIKTYTFSPGYTIVKLCVTANVEDCGITQLDIMFQHPQPDAYISKNGQSGVTTPARLQTSARIELQSPRGDRVDVTIGLTGQISVGPAS